MPHVYEVCHLLPRAAAGTSAPAGSGLWSWAKTGTARQHICTGQCSGFGGCPPRSCGLHVISHLQLHAFYSHPVFRSVEVSGSTLAYIARTLDTPTIRQATGLRPSGNHDPTLFMNLYGLLRQ
jgi:hypothetical protein